MAADFSRTLKGQCARLFTAGPKFEVLDSTRDEFVTYCELHDEECAFLVHVPWLRRFDTSILEDVDARKLLAQTAWQTAQRVLAAQGIGKPKMELAVGLRGISQYGPIMIGYSDDTVTTKAGLLKYLDDGAQTHFLWTFFTPPSGQTNPAVRQN